MQPLSPQEMRLVELIGQGYTLGEAAGVMGISERTARVHADRARLKVGVRRTREIPRVLRELGMLPRP